MLSCSSEDPDIASISVLSTSLNGTAVGSTTMSNIPVATSVVVVFGTALDPAKFEQQISISPATTSQISYSNQSSKATIALMLEFETSYTIKILPGVVGANGSKLSEAIEISFTTVPDGTIHALPPCTSATNDCLNTMSIQGEGGAADFKFYSTYPLTEENAEWTDLKYAIIVVHGMNRDADNYFSYMATTLMQEELADEVILISPSFKINTEAIASEYFWSGNGWREGQNSQNAEKISSFGIIDAVAEQLANQTKFPALEKVVVTGHSSGALFTHLYAAANKAEPLYETIEFNYIVANSQFFYYPDEQRIKESNNQLYTPGGCAGYTLWPMGFGSVPPYVSSFTQTEFNNQFKDRAVTYLLGNGSDADPTLNTTDCTATLLGSSRFNRGVNMFQYMELSYPSNHSQQKVIVNGIGHDGQAMFQSPEFRALLSDILP